MPCHCVSSLDEDVVTIEDLNNILAEILSAPGADEWTTFTDFCSINWNADGVKWFESMQSFFYMLMFARVPGKYHIH